MDSLPYQDDELRQIFRQLPEEKPSDGFSSRVMERIILEAQHAKQRQRWIHRIVWAAFVFFLVVVLPVLGWVSNTYWDIEIVWTYFEPLITSFKGTFSAVTDFVVRLSDTKMIGFGIAVLSLLLGDLFIRRGIERKKQNSMSLQEGMTKQ